MHIKKLTGIKNFIAKHFEKLIFANCLVLIAILYRRDILYSLDGAGRYASAKNLFEVGLHGFNDHFFLGNIQNLFYPPLQDILLGLLIKFNEILLGDFFSDRFIYSFFTVGIFSFYMYALYSMARYLTSKYAKVFFLIFSSWTLYLNIYSFDKLLGHEINFYKDPFVIYFQGLSLQDIFIVGLTNQFLSAAFLVFGILALAKNDRNRTIFHLSMAILSHFIFGLVIVLLCTVKKIFEKDFKNLAIIGAASFGLTAFFVIPLFVYRSSMINVYSMPTRSGFWLTLVTFSFLFLKKKNFSYYLGFGSFLLVAFIAFAKLSERYGYPFPSFHFYRLLFPSLLLFIFTVGFAFNESSGQVRKILLGLVFLIAWTFNFAGHHFDPNLFYQLEPKTTITDAPKALDFSEGRTYAFSLERPIDFTIELNLFLQGHRSFFNKGLYWESAPANRMISSSLYNLMGPPSVLDVGFTHDMAAQSCEVIRCYYKSFLNYSAAYEIWLPSKDTLAQYFTSLQWVREKFVSCFDPLVNSFEKTSGTLEYKHAQFSRYLNTTSAMVRPYSEGLPGGVLDFANKCVANSSDDGSVNRDAAPAIHRNSSGDYLISLPEQKRKWMVSLQYFDGFRYEGKAQAPAFPTSEKLGMVIEGHGPIHLFYGRPWVILISYAISIISSLAIVFWYLAHKRKRSDLVK